MELQHIPAALRDRPQWACWFWGRDGRKVPMNPVTGRAASHSDSGTWVGFAAAAAAVQRGRYPGLNCATGGGLIGIDLDHCIAADSTLSAFAATVVNQLNTYTERSPSGTGLHLWLLGTKPGPRCRQERDGWAIELYDGQHFVSVTGAHWPGTPRSPQARPDALAALYAAIWPPPPLVPARAPVAPLSDTDLLIVAGHSATCRRLLDGDTSRYEHNESRADMALCCSLAGLTRDAAQIDRLYRRSGLYRLPGRDRKWDSPRPGGTYGSWTIDRALAVVSPHARTDV